MVEGEEKEEEEGKNNSTFHIGSFKNPLGNICRFLCQLRFFSSLVTFILERYKEKVKSDWCVCERRKIIWRRNVKRLSGTTKRSWRRKAVAGKEEEKKTA